MAKTNLLHKQSYSHKYSNVLVLLSGANTHYTDTELWIAFVWAMVWILYKYNKGKRARTNDIYVSAKG